MEARATLALTPVLTPALTPKKLPPISAMEGKERKINGRNRVIFGTGRRTSKACKTPLSMPREATIHHSPLTTRVDCYIWSRVYQRISAYIRLHRDISPAFLGSSELRIDSMWGIRQESISNHQSVELTLLCQPIALSCCVITCLLSTEA